MLIPEYPSNNGNPLEPKESEKREKPKIKARFDGEVKRKTEHGVTKFVKQLLPDNMALDPKNYIWNELLIPFARQAILNLFGGSGNAGYFGGYNYSRYSDPFVDYNSRYRGNQSQQHHKDQRGYASIARGYDSVIFQTKNDAQRLLDMLDDVMREYGVLTVGDFYDILNNPDFKGTPNDYDYGWTDIRAAYVTRIHGGWSVKMPRTISLK